MNLVQRLIASIAVLLVMISVQGAASLWQTSRLQAAANTVVFSNEVSTLASLLWDDFLRVEKAYRGVVEFIDLAHTERAIMDYAESSKLLNVRLIELTEHQAIELDHELDIINESVATWIQLANQHVMPSDITSLASPHRLEEAREQLAEQIAILSDTSAAQAKQAIAAADATAAQARTSTLATLSLALVLGVGFGVFAIRSLKHQLGGDIQLVARIANAVADGDLSQTIDSSKLPTNSVLAATARMQASLADTVEQVRRISAELSDDVNQIASGNVDLSSRTENQAMAIEQTASTMDQLGSTAKSTADNAGHASELASRATKIATTGGEKVNQTIQTMAGISDSAAQIAEITGIIDDIAFQTNLLALNAAVEAARAGEHGRGFAVVASEVRSLAQRSAEAAQQIKELIDSSVERVKQGRELADDTGTTMDEVVSVIDDVARMMEQIRTASVEQSSGVVQAGQSITEMDQTTQQNTALAQSSVDTSEKLQSKAYELSQAVAFFQLAKSPMDNYQ